MSLLDNIASPWGWGEGEKIEQKAEGTTYTQTPLYFNSHLQH